jgi:hypothetical protein
VAAFAALGFLATTAVTAVIGSRLVL